MRALLAVSRRQPGRPLRGRSRQFFPAACVASARNVGGVRFASDAKPTVSALRTSAKKFRANFLSHEAIAEIAAEADAPVDQAACVNRLAKELAAGEEVRDVSLQGQVLEPGAAGRRSISVMAPMGLGGGPAVRKVTMTLPNVEDIRQHLSSQRTNKPRVEKPEELADILEKFLTEKFIGKSSDHVGLIAAWGPKPIGDSGGEFGEVAALMALQLRAYKAALTSAKEDGQFQVDRTGDGKDCIVMPPSNFALLGLKDAFKMLLSGFRVLTIVQPRFLPHFQEIQSDLADCGLPQGVFEVLPGITPDADPAVLHEALKSVDRLQFTGSSAMFKSLVTKAYELGNLRLEHAGEVSGLNKLRLDGVAASHPAAQAGAAYAAMGNNGELCTSMSLIEFDPATGDTAESVKASLEGHSFVLGKDPADPKLDILLKNGVSSDLEIKTAIPEDGFREWWAKIALAAPAGGEPHLRTNQSLGYGHYAPSIERAVKAGVKEDASCIYCVGVPADKSAPSARAGTTGAKLPQSVFGGMKSYTFAVAGDHDGVGSVQTLLSTVKRRGANWRDSEEAYAKYELTETAEDLLDFLSPKDQEPFQKQIASVLEVFSAFEPEISKPYDGQTLVGAEGRSQLVSFAALRPSRKNLLIPRGVGLPDDIIKVALLCEMSPLREVPVDLHLLSTREAGKLRVTDPLKSFLRVVEKRLGWKLHYHDDHDQLASALRAAEYPPYFYGVKDKHLLPLEVLMAVAEQGGYLYEGLPSDALTLFRWLTTTQAWTVACTEGQIEEAGTVLRAAWKDGLRAESHEAPEVDMPKRAADIGGGFGAGGFGGPGSMADNDWADLSDDESSSSDSDNEKKNPFQATKDRAVEEIKKREETAAAERPDAEPKAAASDTPKTPSA